MIVILGLDGLDYDSVVNYNCRNLKQCSCGRTDLSAYEELKTVVLWSSFLAQRNIENEVARDNTIWSWKLPVERTFFSNFRVWKAMDVPGFTYDEQMHEKEKVKLKDYFDKKCSIEDYDRIVFEHHQRNKTHFLDNLADPCDIQMGYFALSDAIGHLSFGIKSKMRIVYEELDALAGEVAKFHKEGMLILSDHGMESVGRFGDHSRNGFWSFSSPLNSCGENPLLIEQLFSVFMKTWETSE